MGPPEVLVVDDEPAIRRALERALRLEGFAVRTAAGGNGRARRRRGGRPDVIVLDIAMPDLDGVEVTSRLRADGIDVPICVLSARDEVDDRVAGLQAGADDYLVKPFALAGAGGAPRTPCSAAAARAAERRRCTSATSHVDPAPPAGAARGAAVELTRREFDLLETFVRHPGLVLTRAQLLTTVWGYDFEVDSNVVDVFVGYLRRKLEAEGETAAAPHGARRRVRAPGRPMRPSLRLRVVARGGGHGGRRQRRRRARCSSPSSATTCTPPSTTVSPDRPAPSPTSPGRGADRVARSRLNRPGNRRLGLDEGITRVFSGDTVILEFGDVPRPFPRTRRQRLRHGRRRWRQLAHVDPSPHAPTPRSAPPRTSACRWRAHAGPPRPRSMRCAVGWCCSRGSGWS